MVAHDVARASNCLKLPKLTSGLRPCQLDMTTKSCAARVRCRRWAAGLGLRSAYQTVDHREPPITNITGPNGGHPGFEDCLDYVWFSSASLAPCAVAALPADAALRGENTGGLPNSWCPSDHLPLGASFRFV